MNDLYNQLEQWRSIDGQQYLAKVIYNDENHNCNTIYIGKFEVPNYVIDWRNDICIIYYQYNNYINNPSSEIHINLLRDFDIKSGLLLGFNDRYNYDKTIKNNEKNNDIITDERLIKIIEKNKGSRQIQAHRGNRKP